MDLPQTGRCQCGAIRYAIDAEPMTVYACHCHECQRQSGSGFGLSALFPASAFRFTGGTPAIWRSTGASGREKMSLYCGDCGNRILNRAPDGPIVSIKPGTLDDASWVQAVGHIWTESAQPWTAQFRQGPAYARQPEDFSALRDAWASRRPADADQGERP